VSKCYAEFLDARHDTSGAIGFGSPANGSPEKSIVVLCKKED
jgi:hypothetical protein